MMIFDSLLYYSSQVCYVSSGHVCPTPDESIGNVAKVVYLLTSIINGSNCNLQKFGVLEGNKLKLEILYSTSPIFG